jgi:hypothetical protein
MNYEIYEIKSPEGKIITVKTCGGPVGAYHNTTNKKPTEWTYINDNLTNVNGYEVRKINLSI